MYVPASRVALDRGNEIKPFQKTLFDRLRDLADKHNLVNEIGDEDELQISHETIGNWFSDGNVLVWNYLEETTLGLFPLDSRIRQFCVNALLHRWFDTIILLSILGNSLFLAANNPLDQKNEEMFLAADFMFNIIFLIEFLIKLIAVGATSMPAGYFNDPWNRLDFTVLFLAWLPTLLDFFGESRFSDFSFIRTVRVLKVLKTVNNVPGLKSVGYLLIFIFLLFGILGTQLYMGQLRNRCFPNDVQEIYGNSYVPSPDLCCLPSVQGQECPTGEKCSQTYPGTGHPNENYNQFMNFDNIPNAFLTIFVIISLEGWTDFMYAIMNTSGLGNAGYFIFLVFIGSYFIINLFIAVIYQSYLDTIDLAQATALSELNSSTGGSGESRRPKHHRHRTLVGYLHTTQYLPDFIYEFFTYNESYCTMKAGCAALAETAEFHWSIVLFIMLNLSALAIQANGSSDETNHVLGIINFICTIVFVIELFIRIIATDIFKFFRIGFNVVDTAIVIVSVSEIFTRNAQTTLSAFRTLRVFRTFKLLTRWESLQQLVNAVFKSGPGLGYFCVILSLDIFVCALAGIALFAGKLGNESNSQYGNSRENFDDLFFALLTTFQIISGENWNDVLFRAMDMNPVTGAIFFVFVYFIGNLIVLNLFLAILLENFSEGRYREDKISYYEQLDQQRDVQVVVSTVWDTITSVLKRQVWAGCSSKFCQFFIQRHWLSMFGLVRTTEDDGNGSGDEDDDSNTPVDYDADDEQQRDVLGRNSDEIIRTSQFQFHLEIDGGTGGGTGGSNGSLRRVRMSKQLDRSPQNSERRRSSMARQRSVWGGWDHEKEMKNSQSRKFLEDDSIRRSVLGDILCGQYRRGNRYFNDCFLGVELVDILLDRGIVSTSTEGIAMGQELVFRRKLLPVWILTQEGEDENEGDGEEGNGNGKRRKGATSDDDNSSHTPISQQVNGDEEDEEEKGGREDDLTCHSPTRPYLNKKFSAVVEAQFRDDRSLYRLSDQGEQVTEWLMSSHEAKKTMILHRKQQKQSELNLLLEDYSFGIFSQDNWIRQLCGKVILHKYFELFVVFMIITSSIFLALDSPHLKHPSTLATIVTFTDISFTIFFIAEMVIKMIAMGVISTPKAYLKNGWNILDFVVVFLSILSLSLQGFNLSFLKAFRATRALRPLRMVSRSPGMRAVVNAIIMVIPPLANFVLVVSVFLFTFAILGASLFGNRMSSCVAKGNWSIDDEDLFVDEYRYVFNKDQCSGNLINSNGYEVTLQWKSAQSNFDSMGNAFLTLFELSNMENWPGIMYPAMDIPDHESHAPIMNYSRYNALFFVSFIIVGAFFITNLFVGIIVHKFNRARMLDSGSVFLTDDQRRWLSDMKAAMSARPQNQIAVPGEEELFGFKRPIYYLVNSSYFALTMDFFIILNIFVMTLEHYNQSDSFTNALYVLNAFFAGIFSLELVLKLMAFGIKIFLKDSWTQFDFLIVIGALLDISGIALVFNVTIFRVLRVGRILRLLKSSKNMIVLLKTLFFSLPSLVNVGSLLFLAFFIFAIIGMNLFGLVTRDGKNLTQYANFEYFGSSLLLLIRCMTGEGWNDVMHYLKDQGHAIAVPYFALFLITCPYMLLNLFIAVILENFEAALAADPDKVQQKNLEDFIEAWAEIHDELVAEDNDRLPCYTLVKLIHMLPPPLGIKSLPETELGWGDNGQRQLHRNFVLSFVRSLDLKEDSKGRVYFVDVIAALVRRSQIKLQGGRNVVATMSVQQRQELQYRMRKMTKHKMIHKLEVKMKDEVFTEIDLAVEFNAAMAMQAMWRGKQSREKLRSIIALMIQQQRESRLQGSGDGKEKKKNRKTLTKFLWQSSRRWRSGSKSNLSVDSDNSPTDNSTVVTKKSGLRSDAEENNSASKSHERRSPFLERGSSPNTGAGGGGGGRGGYGALGLGHEDDDEDESTPPPIAQLEFMTSRPISSQSLQSEAGISKQNSWLPPLRSPFSSRPASFRREVSQLSGISGITLSSWESNIERNLRKQGQQQSPTAAEAQLEEEAIKEEVTPEQTLEYNSPAIDIETIPEDRPTSLKTRRQSMLLREDSRAHWLPNEVVSSRAIMNPTAAESKSTANETTSPTKERGLKRSRTLSSLPTTLAQLTGMSHFLTRQDSNRSVSEKDVVIERSVGIIRLGSAESANEGMVVDAPDDLEIKIDAKPSKRFTITGATLQLPFSPRTPREIQKSRSRRRTIARGNSDGSSPGAATGSGGESPELGLRKHPSAVYLSHSPSSRSLGGHLSSSSRSILSPQDSPTTSGRKFSSESKYSQEETEGGGSSSNPSKLEDNTNN